MTMIKPQITVRIPLSLLTSLNGYVEKMSTTKTEVVVSALLHYLEGIDDIPLSQRLAKIEGKMRELEAEVKGKSQ